MEHIIQFGVNIDDDAIRRTIENNIQKKVEEKILEDVKAQITGSSTYSSWSYSERIKGLINNATTKFLEDNKDEIIEETSKKLVKDWQRQKL